MRPITTKRWPGSKMLLSVRWPRKDGVFLVNVCATITKTKAQVHEVRNAITGDLITLSDYAAEERSSLHDACEKKVST